MTGSSSGSYTAGTWPGNAAAQVDRNSRGRDSVRAGLSPSSTRVRRPGTRAFERTPKASITGVGRAAESATSAADRPVSIPPSLSWIAWSLTGNARRR